MRNRYTASSVLSLGVVLVAAFALPVSAQRVPGEKLLVHHVTVQCESARLGQVLKSMMSSLGASYVISNEIKDSVVTADLADVPLKNALAALGRVGNIPMSYSLEDGIFYFTRRTSDEVAVTGSTDVASPEQTQRPSDSDQVVTSIGLTYSDAGVIAQILGGFSVQVSYQNFGILGLNGLGRNSGARGGGFGLGGANGAGAGNGGAPGAGLGSGFGSGNVGILNNPGGFSTGGPSASPNR